jgi:hypothetical protein
MGQLPVSVPPPAREWHNVRVACCVRAGECGIEHLGERSTIDLARAVERRLVQKFKDRL